ncbi:hypothetical protein [Rubellicoccus peritrichatus]|uniref:Ice-binding protein C-terminal domain-containing protein n=1 Tax=Rubellicoccus peritrichatus TaxID=3080537 RepID=A0AAQ3QVM2_9BACT|nr:hypothetical protein [Puniceicoccus sp. CR14]WOO43531.1 hypothetical protein RZN69_10570 [Puniceicoccus sp. CR14]
MASKKVTSSTLSLIMAGSAHATIQYTKAPANYLVGFAGDDPIDIVWDVDNNGHGDFRLMATTKILEGSFMTLQMGNYGTIDNSNAFILGTGEFKKVFNLPNGQVIGPSPMITVQTTISFEDSPSVLTYRAKWPSAGSLSSRIIFSNDWGLATEDNDSNALLSNFPGNPIDGKEIYFNIGFRFIGSDNQTHYGWASLSMTGEYGNSDDSDNDARTTILSWAYEDEANTPITVGQVPEPSAIACGLGALALGAAGLRSWRRSRKNRM